MATSKRNRKKSAVPAASATRASAPVAEDAESELAAEYGYVRKDLRQLSLVSLVLFAVMLGIGFFI
jgi:hypothetical protein